jgi:hypothetical protein
MGTRRDFQTLLESLGDLSNPVSVYFQPPPEIQMSYPAIVYNRDYLVNQFADNIPYAGTNRYQVTLIDADPDSPLNTKLKALPMTRFVRHFTSANLNHDIYNVYF